MPPNNAIRAGRAFVEVFADDRKLVRGLRRSQKRLKAFGRNVSKLGLRLTALSASALVPIAFSTRIFIGFSDKMKALQAITGATADQFNQLNERIKKLGRTTSFTAAEIAGASVELGRAGFKPDEIDTLIASMLNLARATGTDLSRAAEIAGNALRGFNLPATQMQKVADVMTAAANNSSQSLDDLSEAMKFVAPIALAAGSSIEDTAASIGILANNGLKGTIAGTALARAYKNLANDSIRKQVEDLGVTVADSNGDLLSLSSILSDIGNKTKRLGSANRLGIFEKIFGRGSVAALSLSKSGAQFETLLGKLKQSQGVAAKTAEIMDSGLGGAFRRMTSAIEGVSIAIGGALSKELSSIASFITKAASAIARFIKLNKSFIVGLVTSIVVVAAVGGALVATGLAITIVGVALGALASVLSLVAAIAATTIGAVGAVIGALLSPIGLVVAAVVALGATVLIFSGAGAKALAFLGDRFVELKDFAIKAFGGIADALAAGDIGLAAKILWLSLKLAWQKGVAALQAVWLGFKQAFLTVANDLFFGAVAAMEIAFHGFEVAFIETAALLSKVWIQFTSGFRKVWNTAVNFVAKRLIDLQGLADSSLDTTGAKKLLDQNLRSSNNAVDRQRNAALTEAERQRQRRRKDAQRTNEQTLAVIGQQAEAANKKLSDQTDKQLSATASDLDKARQEWLDAIDQAKNQRAKGPGPAGGDSGNAPNINDLINQLKGAGAGLSGVGGVRGTFNAAAIQGLMSGSGVAERTAKAAEDTARNTKKIDRKISTSNLAFA